MILNYKIDGVPIGNYGVMATRGRDIIGLSGLFDLPKRTGKTEHSWGTEIEPFVSADDIQLDGRLLTLNVAMKHHYLSAFMNACFACTSFAVDFDTFDVVCRDEIEVVEIGDYSSVVVKFWQNDFHLIEELTPPRGVSGRWMMDDYSLTDDFGIYVSKATRMQNGGKRIEVSTTEFYTQTEYRAEREIDLHCFMKGSGVSDLYSKMRQFQKLLMSPGLRTFANGNEDLNLYFKNGINATLSAESVLQFTLKATCTNWALEDDSI